MDLSIEIVTSGAASSVEAVRRLWSDYWQAFGLAPDFQNFAKELETLPGAYGPPAGRLLLARVGDDPAGTAAFRPLHDGACEAKRLYVKPDYRGRGLARSLLRKIVAEARHSGYRDLFGDTLPAMASALQLYREIGFVECGPYSETPTTGAIYFRLSL